MHRGKSEQPNAPLLLVEDSLEDVFFLKRAFKKLGFSPPLDHVQNGAVAQFYLLRKGEFAHLANKPLPRLILSDIKMPICSGLELLARLRAEPELASIPLVMWSSSEHQRDLEQAQEMGALHYLVKPSNLNGFDEVARAVEQIWTFDCKPWDSRMKAAGRRFYE